MQTHLISETSSDMIYNYTCTLCHYGSLMVEFKDAWAEGDGDRIFRCWQLFLPHFRASKHTKYSLEAFRLQLQVKVVLSPNLAHQVKWNRFVNTKGGLGRNIPCDLFNDKQIKCIIQNMGPNLTEAEPFAALLHLRISPSILTKRVEFQSLLVLTQPCLM